MKCRKAKLLVIIINVRRNRTINFKEKLNRKFIYNLLKQPTIIFT